MARTSVHWPATSRRRDGSAGGRGLDEGSDLDPSADLELHEPPHREQLRQVVLAAEGGEHPRQIAHRCDRGTEALADWLEGRCSPEVFIAASALGFRNDLEFAAVGRVLGHGFELWLIGKRGSATVRALS